MKASEETAVAAEMPAGDGGGHDRLLFEANPNPMFVFDEDSLRLLAVNEAMVVTYGWTREELLSMKATDLRPPEESRRLLAVLATQRGSCAAAAGEWRHQRKDGSCFEVEVTISCLEYEGMEARLVMVNDITERKRHEAALRESEKKYRTLFDSIGEGFCVVEMVFGGSDKAVDYRFLEVNPAFEIQSGIRNAVGRKILEINPQHEERWLEVYGRIALTGEPVRFEHFSVRSGRWFEVSAYRYGNPENRQVAILFNDISLRKKVEEALRESEERLRVLGDNLPDSAVYQYTHNKGGKGVFLLISAGIERLNGVTVEEVLRDSEVLLGQIAPEIREEFGRAKARSLREMSDFDRDVPMRRRDGEVRWMRLHSRPRCLPDGQVVWDGVQTDITERKQVQFHSDFLNQLAPKLMLEPDPGELVRLSLRALVGHLGADHANFGEFTPDGSELTVREEFRDGRPPIMGTHRAADYVTDEARESLMAGQGYMVHDVATDRRTSDYVESFRRVEVAAYMTEPLVTAEGAKALITVTSRQPRTWRPDEAQLLRDLAARLFPAVERARAEEALRESEALLRIFVEHAPVALAMFDRDMCYLAASRRWSTDYSLGDRDLSGFSHYDIFPEITEHWQDVHRRGLAGEVMGAQEDRFQRADGSVQWVRWAVRPWYDAAGAVGGIVIFAEEITARVEAAREQEKLMRLIEASPDFIAMADLDGRITFINAGGRRMIGLDAGEDAGALSFTDYTPEPWQDFFLNAVIPTAL
ncbi:MAG: PAS domain S-box protein, partial [Luteolibacter sp.]